MLTLLRSDSAAAFSSANTTLLRLARFLDLRSLTSGSVLPGGEMGSTGSAFCALGGGSSSSKLKEERDSVATAVRAPAGPPRRDPG